MGSKNRKLIWIGDKMEKFAQIIKVWKTVEIWHSCPYCFETNLERVDMKTFMKVQSMSRECDDCKKRYTIKVYQIV